MSLDRTGKSQGKEDEEDNLVVEEVSSKDTKKLKQLEKEMIEAVKKLNLRKQPCFVTNRISAGEGGRKSLQKQGSADTKKGSMEAGKNIIKRSSLIWVSFLVFLSDIPCFWYSQKRQLLFYFWIK